MGSSVRLKLTTISALILVASLAWFGTIRFTTHAASISHDGSPSSFGHSHSQTVTCGQWNIVPSPNQSSANNFLLGVAALSPTDAWAVGSHIEHWDGTSWSIVPSPQPGWIEFLGGVAAISTNDVWAVGWYYPTTSNTQEPLIEHWDGSMWSIASSPAGPNDAFYAVTALSTSDIWAVGNIIEHWDGTSWSIVPNPVGTLSGVTALSTNNVWAVGEVYNSSKKGDSTLVEHWYGTSWSIVPSWNSWRRNNILNAVTQVPGTKYLWAAGDSYTWSKGSTRTLIEDWNGTSWGEVPNQNPGSYNYLYGVTAIARNNIWAVGSFTNALGSSQAFIEHGGTKGFTVVSTINITPNNVLRGVTHVPGTNQLWAVGQAGGTLIAFYC